MLASNQPHFFSTESMPISLATSRNESEKSIIYQHDDSFSSDFGELPDNGTNMIRE